MKPTGCRRKWKSTATSLRSPGDAHFWVDVGQENDAKPHSVKGRREKAPISLITGMKKSTSRDVRLPGETDLDDKGEGHN